jgi:hypothetical protein
MSLIKTWMLAVIAWAAPTYFVTLVHRMGTTAVGLTGHVSDLDRAEAAKQQLRPLTRFELWLLHEIIVAERAYRQDCFRQACINVLGEDPNDWR